MFCRPTCEDLGPPGKQTQPDPLQGYENGIITKFGIILGLISQVLKVLI